MSRKDNFIKSKANYTLYKKHIDTSRGIVYEQDYVTIQPMDGLFNEDEIAFSDSIFKFKVRKGGSSKKKHTRGNWAKWINEKGESGITWQINTMPTNSVSSDSKIIIKPNYNSLSDFACYGSAVDLIHASVNDIIAKFPGSLILTDNCINSIKESGSSETILTIPNSVGDDIDYKLYEISNETFIDVDTSAFINAAAVENPMRYLGISIDKYTNKDGGQFSYTILKRNEGQWCDGTIVAEVEINGIQIFVYYKNNRKYLVSPTSGNEVLIKPKNEYIEEFFQNLDEFEKVLLDRTSFPLYKATFDTPYTNDEGYFYKSEAYVWPKLSDGVSLDFSSSSYFMYIEKLIKLATFHDNYDADNIWRQLTHEAIKNLDWTFVRQKDGESYDMSDLDSSRIEMIAKLYGRQYDDLLKNINNIKSITNVSYDEKNNIPDYFLSDTVSLDGWELKNISPTSDNALETDSLYEGLSKGYTGQDANNFFLRFLKLNSSYLNSLKGTKRGVETLLGLFGMEKDKDYKIYEYIAVAKPNNGKNYPSFDEIENWNLRKDNSEDFNDTIDYLSGLPLMRVMSGENFDYVVPWFDKNKAYDGNIYFQMKGGWGKTFKKDINLQITTEKIISGRTIYSETLQYLKFADSISDMLSFTEDSINEGDICYVTNITDITGYTWGNEELTTDISELSHYFKLETKLYSTILGYEVNSGCYGWKGIKYSEYDGTSAITENGQKVLYLESIQTKEDGNNPHCGYGNYDEGEEYLDYFRQIFKYSCDNDKFSSLNDEEIEKVSSYGYDIEIISDNKKCHFFEDTQIPNRIVKIGNQDDENYDDFYKDLYNPESLPTYDEAAANSVINVKNFKISFFTQNGLDEERDYLINIVLPYVEQMIPSTAIFSYTIDSKPNSWDLIDSKIISRIKADGVIFENNEIDNTTMVLSKIKIKN